MPDILSERPFPRGAIIAAGVMMALSITAATVARYGHVGTLSPAPAPAAVTRNVHFADRSDGAVVVTDAVNGHEVAVLAPGTNGFIRGVMRGLARGRRLAGVGDEPPFQIIQRTDGRLDLVDPTTGRDIALEAFGHTQVEAFAVLLNAKE
jgi:putative photosynthetic complex assembly protein